MQYQLERDAVRGFHLFYETLNDEGKNKFGEMCRAKFDEIIVSDEKRKVFKLTAADVTALRSSFLGKPSNRKLVVGVPVSDSLIKG